MAADEDEPKSAMPGGPRQRPPVTIDLTAEDIGGRGAQAAQPKPAAAREEPPRPPPRKDARPADAPLPPPPSRPSASEFFSIEGWQRNGVAAVAGGIVALVLVLVLQIAGILPSPGRSLANQSLEEARTTASAVAALEKRMSALEAMSDGIPAMRNSAASMGDRLSALESAQATLARKEDLAALQGSVDALNKRLDAAPAGVTREDLAALTERVTRMEVSAAAGGSDSGASTAAINSLSTQLAAAEAAMRALGERVAAAEAKAATAAPAGGPEAAHALALATLRRAAESSAPFAADVELAAGLGIDSDAIAALRPLAEKGVADKTDLATEFPGVAETILTATAASDRNAGFFQRLLGSLVSIRPTGPMAGSDPAAIVSRMRDDVAKGDLAAALGEREALPAAGKEASAAWAAKAADRVALDALVERIARGVQPAKAG